MTMRQVCLDARGPFRDMGTVVKSHEMRLGYPPNRGHPSWTLRDAIYSFLAHTNIPFSLSRDALLGRPGAPRRLYREFIVSSPLSE